MNEHKQDCRCEGCVILRDGDGELVENPLGLEDTSPAYDMNDDLYDDSMDGDHESALTSAGYGTDEDYGYYGDNEPDDGGDW